MNTDSLHLSVVSPSCEDKELEATFRTVYERWTRMREKAMKWLDRHVGGPFEVSSTRVYWDAVSCAEMNPFPGFVGRYSDAFVSGQIDRLLDHVADLKSLLRRQHLYDIVGK